MREILFLVLITFNTAAYSTNYYISNKGNDSSNGLTPSTAWKTISKVNSQTYKPGDSILFERGGTWYENLRITASGNSSGQITYSAYGSGDRPVITGIEEISGWKIESSWNSLGSNVWSMKTDGIVGRRLWIDNQEKARSRENILGRVTKDYPWQFWNGTLYVYSSSNPAITYSKIESSSSASFLHEPRSVDYITISHLDIRGWRWTRLYGCSYWIIEHCNFGWGFSEYGLRINSNSGTLSVNGIIRDCIFDSGDRLPETRNYSNYAPRYNTEDAIVITAGVADWDIHNNYLRGWGHTAFAARASLTDVRTIEGIRVFNNYFTSRGQSYGRAIGGGFAKPGNTNPENPVEFFNNVIEDQGLQSQMAYPYAKIYNNIWNKTRGADNDPNQHGNAVGFEGGGRYPSYMQVYNNIFAYSGSRAVHIPGYPGHNPAEKIVFRNNIFYENAGVSFRAGDYGDELVNSNVFENNIFYSSAGSNIIEVYGKRMNVATFNSLDGSGGQNFITSGNLQSDPLFVDPARGDFRLKPDSPAIGKGLPTISDHDLNGAKWQQPVSIGVYEMSGTKDPQPAERFSLEVLLNGYGTVNSADETGVSSLTADIDTELTLEAVANEGWFFSNWEGDYTGTSNPLTVKMDKNKTITAVFAASIVVHTLETEVKGNGSVKSRRPLKESKTVEENAVLLLDATPDYEWEFSHWEGDASGTDNPLEVLMDCDKSIIAVFNQKTYTITIIYEGVGTVDIFPKQESYTAGTMVNLSAIAGHDWQFGEWAGDLHSSDTELSLIILGDTELTVKFNSIITNADQWPEIQKINIYPNPATDFINISVDGSEDPDGFKIIDFSGRIVFQGMLNSSITDIQIPDFIKSGVYIIELISKKLPIHTQRLLITN